MNILKRVISKANLYLNSNSIYSLNGIELYLENLSQEMRYYIVNKRYEEEERRLCDKVLDETDQVLELGSSIGFLSLYCIKKIKVRDFYCVEPNPEALYELKRNFAINQVSPNVIEACLAEDEKDITLYTNSSFWECNTIGGESLNYAKSLTVKGNSLRSILSSLPFKPSALIIDVEGAETVLKAGDFSPEIKKIIIELHPKITGTKVAYKVLNEMMNAGFEVIQKLGDSYALIKN